MTVLPSLAKQISIVEAKETVRKRPEDDPVRRIIEASDDNLTSSDFANLVKICLRLMREKEGEAPSLRKTSPKLPASTGGSGHA